MRFRTMERCSIIISAGELCASSVGSARPPHSRVALSRHDTGLALMFGVSDFAHTNVWRLVTGSKFRQVSNVWRLVSAH